MRALGLDIGSRATKLAWHAGDELETATVDVHGYEPEALRSALGTVLGRSAIGRVDGVVVALPEAWRDDPGSPAAALLDVVEAVVDGARVRPVGAPVAVAHELTRAAPEVTRPVVVDAGAGTVEVAAVATDGRPRLVRHEVDDPSGDALDTVFRSVCAPLLERDEQIDVVVVGGHAVEKWVGDTVRRATGRGQRLHELPVDDPLTCAARGALRLAGETGDLAQRYPWPVKSWVGLRRNGRLTNEELRLAEAKELEIGSFTPRPLFVPEEPVRVGSEGEGVAELPRVWTETPDRCHLLTATVPDLPPGRYTVDLHLDSRCTGSLLIRSVGPDRTRVVLAGGRLPSPAPTFPAHLKRDLDRIGSWGVRETRHVPGMRVVGEKVLRELPRNRGSDTATDGRNQRLVDAVLTEEPTRARKNEARAVWRDIIARWKEISGLELEEPEPPPGQKDRRERFPGRRALWEALRRVDHHLQGVPTADWPSSLADVQI